MTEHLALTTQISLPLYNGWTNYGGVYGNCTIKKEHDLVTITGMIKEGRWGVLAILPTGYRPIRRLIFRVNNHQTSARIDVLPDGRIVWINGDKRHRWISLSGIIFPTKQGNNLELKNNWSHYGGSWEKANLFKTPDGIVVLSGVIRGSRSGTIAWLPRGNRPANNESLVFSSGNRGNSIRIDIHPGGKIEWKHTGVRTSWISLSGITFPIRQDKLVPLTNKWINYGKKGNRIWRGASLIKTEEGLVNLGGRIKNGGWGDLAVLPTEYCPDKKLVYSVNNHNSVSRVDIFPDGRIMWVSGGRRHQWISLSGIQFYAKYKEIPSLSSIVEAAKQSEANAFAAATNAIQTLQTLQNAVTQSSVLDNTIRAHYNDKKHAIVSLLIEIYGATYMGSGFIIKAGNKHYICTAGHNVLGNNRNSRASKIIASISRDQREPKSVLCTVLGVAGYADVAVLEMSTTLSNLTHLDFADDQAIVKNGDVSIVLGDPKGLDAQSFSTGCNRDVQYVYGTNIRCLSTTAPCYGGNSGSPILDKDFNVIGIISYGISGTDTLSWGAHYSVLKIVVDHITSTRTNYIGGTLHAELELVDNVYAYYKNKNTQTLEGYYITSPSPNGVLEKDDIILKINGETLGVYDNQVSPVAIYLNKDKSISLKLEGRSSEISVIPSGLSLSRDIYLGAGSNIDLNGNAELRGPVKIE